MRATNRRLGQCGQFGRNFEISKQWRSLLLGTIAGLVASSTLPARAQPRIGQDGAIACLEDVQQFVQEHLYESADRCLQAVAAYWQSAGDRYRWAIALADRGRVQLSQANPRAAAEFLQEAIALFEGLEESDELSLKQARIFYAKALRELGFYRRACRELGIALVERAECFESLLSVAPAEPPTPEEKAIALLGWHELGNVWRELGQLKASRGIFEALQASWELSPQSEVAILLSLGNTWQAMGEIASDRQAPARDDYLPWQCEPHAVSDAYNYAASYYEKVANNPVSPAVTRLQARLAHLGILLETEELAAAGKEAIAIKENVADLAASPYKTRARLLYAQHLVCLQSLSPNQDFSWEEIQLKLETSLQEARKLGDRYTLAWVLGKTGGFYEYLARQGNTPNRDLLQTAIALTQEALWHSQSRERAELTYQWQWQLGRLQQALGENERAIAMYDEAIQTLEFVRRDLIATDSDVRFSFRDNIEPLYRQTIRLLLDTETESDDRYLWKAIAYFDALQLTELENFLQCNLQETFGQEEGDRGARLNDRVDLVLASDPSAALIYAIVLGDRLEVILALPERPLVRATTTLPAGNYRAILGDLPRMLAAPKARRNAHLHLSQQVRNWLLTPETIAPALADSPEVNTLVFVLDGPLRNVPMAALHDGEQYLIEEYAIALNPVSALLRPRRLPPKRLRLLAAGIAGNAPSYQTISGMNFNSLTLTEDELGAIAQVTEVEQILLDAEFTTKALEQELNANSFQVLHLSTHARFSSNPEETYILAWDDRLQISQLDRLIRDGTDNSDRALKLLVLSACETARGDKRATLGLAGVALRAGAESTIATLWEVRQGGTTTTVKRFYRHWLADEKPLAIALQAAQKEMLNDPNYQHPSHWAAFTLVGSWW